MTIEDALSEFQSSIASTVASKEENYDRFILFPIRHDAFWNMYKRAESSFWRVEEIDLRQDREDWKKLNKDEQFFISSILGFFAGSDGIVAENLVTRFYNEIQIPEVRCFYGFQLAIENIHTEMYSLLIDTLVTKDQEKLFQAINLIPCVKQKANWGNKWMTDKVASFAQRLVGFAMIEGIFFSGSFCAIFWLKKRGLMPGLTCSNEFISRDEALHTDFAVLLYNSMDTLLRIPEEVVRKMMQEAVAIEEEFITQSLPCQLIGMNADLMIEYIHMVADRLMIQLGYKKIWSATNPFSFMEMITMTGKTNFFERRVSEYALETNFVGDDAATVDGSQFALDALF